MISLRSRFLGVLLALFGALQFVPGVGVPQAQAQTFACSSASSTTPNAGCASRQQAYEECKAAADAYPSEVVSCAVYGGPNGYQCYGTSFHACTPAPYRYFPWPTANGGCPVGSVWDEPSHTCFNSAACLSRADIPFSGTTNLSLSGGDRCDDGCKVEYQGGQAKSLTTGGGDAITVGTGGKFVHTGAACATGEIIVSDPNVDPPDQACITDSTSGRTTCVNKYGRNCYKLSGMLRQICWDNGETGEKTDGDTLQVRNAGSVPTTPQTAPPQGDSFVQDGQPVTVTSNVTTTTTNTTNVTTTTDYKTANGTDAGGTSAGEPADGTGAGATQTGESDAERNSLLGGIKDKLSQLYDGFTGDGQDHAGDGADPADTQVWSDDEVVDGSALDTSGMSGGSGSCPAVFDTVAAGDMSAAFLIDTPPAWCDFVAKCKTILILFAIFAGIVLVWRN